MNTTPRHQRPISLKKFLFGCPYYPEHWTDDLRARDPQMMADAGVNVVRMGEFAWDLMEPRRGEFDFSVFDQAIERLAKVGIGTIMCTPTATPPRWLTMGHDDWMRVSEDGKRMEHGSRQHVCTTAPDFRAESRRITAAMAEHFAGNPNVIGWQTDNELNCHFSLCYCHACKTAFGQWLARRYGEIAKLNAAWGTQFWSQTYDSFEQIPLPYPSSRPAGPNPTHELDYYRFTSDMVIEFQRQQVEILRKARRDWFITHNGLFAHVDYWKFAQDLDFMGVDIYPAFGLARANFESRAAFNNQCCRAVSGGYIVPEQQTGPGAQRTIILETPQPGQMRLWAYQSIANGADGMLHFRWRTARFGAEEYWCGVLDHDSVPRRRHREFAQEGQELKRLGETILGTTQDVRAAVLRSFDQIETQLTYHMDLPGTEEIARLAFDRLWRQHMPCGLVDASDSLAGLEFLLLPSLVMMDEELAARLRRFVEGGGVLVATARTATRNTDNQVIAQTPPGLLAELFGCTVEEYGKLNPGTISLSAGAAGSQDIPCGTWYEWLAPRGAEVAATWSAPAEFGPCAAAGQPAVTVNRVGKGAAICVGTYLSLENAKAIMDLALAYAALTPLGEADEKVEITRRRDDKRSLMFVLNHSRTRQHVKTSAGTELISRKPCNGQLDLEPYEVAIIREK